MEFNDEIVSIEELDEQDCIDIQVSDDHLFVSNCILTSNSYALPMTLDYLGGIIQDDDMFKEGKYLLKVLKTRFGGNRSEVYTIGVDRSHMLLHESETQELPMHVKDRMAFFDKRRDETPSSGKDAIFVYDDEI